jgi:hypothetical protein
VDRVPDSQTVAAILIEECGAAPDYLELCAFDHHWPCSEFRFIGGLGFGGKVHYDQGRARVSCYAEHRTAERLAMIDRANARLAARP